MKPSNLSIYLFSRVCDAGGLPHCFHFLNRCRHCHLVTGMQSSKEKYGLIGGIYLLPLYRLASRPAHTERAACTVRFRSRPPARPSRSAAPLHSPSSFTRSRNGGRGEAVPVVLGGRRRWPARAAVRLISFETGGVCMGRHGTGRMLTTARRCASAGSTTP